MASPLTLASFRGGINNTDSPIELAPNQCIEAENVEFVTAPCGERRNGCTPLNLTGAGLDTATAIVHISEWFPANDPTDSEIFVIGLLPSGAALVARRTRPSVGGTWSNPTLKDAISVTLTGALGLLGVYRIQAQASRGLIPLDFFAYPSLVDRLHVWDGTTLRRAGLAGPIAAPTAANTGAGALTGVRYYRVRFTEVSGSRILRRSEPSPSTAAFTPSGGGSGVLVTRPGLADEGENTWEIEGSADDANFYLLDRLPIASTTYTDTAVSALNYPDFGTLSEDIGEYTPFPSVAYVAVDGDRLLGGGHQTDGDRMSSLYWSPRFNDPGVGNNERLPLSVDNTVNLDNGTGGPVTGISEGFNGVWYAFKWSRLYQLLATTDVTRAYVVNSLSSTQGAVPGSVINAEDDKGNPCVFFIEPKQGPSRIINGQVQALDGQYATWRRANVDATGIIAHGVYYPDKKQVHWWITVDGAEFPNLKIVLQTNNIQSNGRGQVYGCWTHVTGRLANAYCSAMITEPATLDGLKVLSHRPFIGMTATANVQRCDDGDTDAGTEYTGLILSQPFLSSDLNKMWGVLKGTLLADVNDDWALTLQLVRDMGELDGEQQVSALIATRNQTMTLGTLSDVTMSEARMIQVRVSEQRQ